MTNRQAEDRLWLAFVNAESQRDHARPRDLMRFWRARLLRAIRMIGRTP
jgi:hypothetical protein